MIEGKTMRPVDLSNYRDFVLEVTSEVSIWHVDIKDRLASEIVWDRSKIIEELSINVSLGRENGAKQLAASNQAINLIGKAINVFEPETQQINVTAQILHGLSDTTLEALEALVSEPLSINSINDTDAIEAEFKIVDPD